MEISVRTSPTMTSLELVEYINSERKELAHADGAAFPSKGYASLDHADLVDKVYKVLGEAAPTFLGTAFYTNGTGAKVSRTIYNFPKREACLMAMSYSYALQAKVYDKLEAMERALEAPVISAEIDRSLDFFQSCQALCLKRGFSPKMAHDYAYAMMREGQRKVAKQLREVEQEAIDERKLKIKIANKIARLTADGIPRIN